MYRPLIGTPYMSSGLVVICHLLITRITTYMACLQRTSLRATDCQGIWYPFSFYLISCNGIKPISAQELTGTSEIYSCCLKTNSFRSGFHLTSEVLVAISVFLLVGMSYLCVKCAWWVKYLIPWIGLLAPTSLGLNLEFRKDRFSDHFPLFYILFSLNKSTAKCFYYPVLETGPMYSNICYRGSE